MANVDNIIRIYDNNMVRVAYLQNAYKISYEKNLNSLWYASFTMPADDPKNLFIQPFYYAEIFDNGERVELFRIMPSKLGRNTKGEITYECEHVLATLLDDVLFQYHQIGNVGIPTVQCLRYVLDRQTVKRWQLAVNEFTRYFEYKWENENLLSALFSIPQPFNTAYKWEYDTTVYPWRISLKALTSDFKADITYKKNMLSIEKEVDPTTVVTRLYLLGYGEGDNQLDIRAINGGIPYLEANTSKYGIKTSILVDRRFESPETLKAYGQSMLNELKEPYRSYKVQALDLAKTDNLKYESFVVGDMVRITDKEDGITEDLRIVSIKKSDLTGDIGSIEIEIANKSRDIAGSITQLADRTRINEVYAQGATNLMSIPFNDNADTNNPAILRFYVPEEMARINKLILNYQLEPFRAYSKAVQGGGSTATTTSSGGGTSTTSGSGGGQFSSTDSGGGEYSTTSTEEEGVEIRGYIPGGTPYIDQSEYIGFAGLPDHSHGLPTHTHYTYIDGHSHDFVVPSHTHSFQVQNHTHSINIQSHSHSFSLPNHTHELEFGIYQGSTASSATLKIDGQSVNITNKEVDLIPCLSKDAGGKVQRGTWHTVEIVPNSLTRVVANIFFQLFTNSRGGGDF